MATYDVHMLEGESPLTVEAERVEPTLITRQGATVFAGTIELLDANNKPVLFVPVDRLVAIQRRAEA